MSAVNSLAEAWTTEPLGRVAAPLREQVVVKLRQAITDCTLKPGQRLVERELIERLGVSRTTVREALRELASEGLVTIVPQKGAVVTAPTLEEAIDLYEVRASLESLTVRRFAERATDSQVQRLRASVHHLNEVSIRTEDIQQVLAAKDLFYAVLVEGAGSEVLRQLLEGIKARVQVLRATSLSVSGRTFQAVDELRAIVDAIAAQDAELASRLCAEHVMAAANTALMHLREEMASQG